ncbi:hypothetical protein BVC80_9083g32 [Macleaya cordata]|uniref:Uncharacterized protein n=1 Tax=Macleaya cordata TaxID=56857 RepID=A0A200PRC3_MACCD|nr:hypothetical protein BVC80_9083g32 [Macleaya cordata]
MEITEEQRKRAEANRLAALAKRKASTSVRENPWKFFKCCKVSPELAERDKQLTNALPKPPNHFSERFRVRLEICSPDSFSITPEALPGSPYLGETQCLQKLNDVLSFVRTLSLSLSLSLSLLSCFFSL